MEQSISKTAVITGASAGLGREFVKELIKNYPEIDEIWLIARRYDKMKEREDQFPNKKFKIIAIS